MFRLFLSCFRILNEPLPLSVPPLGPGFLKIDHETWGGEGGTVSYSPKKWAWVSRQAVGAVAYPSSQHSQCCMGIPSETKWKRP